jgi:cytochrome c
MTTPIAKILVTEDDQVQREVVADILLRAGYDVATADSGEASLEALEKDVFNLLLTDMRMPNMDPQRGRKLFVTKGCVACHAINGVGGHDATNLDAHTMQSMMNPFEFAAKMWAMAPAMIYAQEEALGEQILFTGDELADIIAFVHDDDEQHHFTDADVSPEAVKMMNHSHGAAGGGPAAHGEDIGHHHGAAMPDMHHDDGASDPPAQ